MGTFSASYKTCIIRRAHLIALILHKPPRTSRPPPVNLTVKLFTFYRESSLQSRECSIALMQALGTSERRGGKYCDVPKLDLESELSQHTMAMLKEHLAEAALEGPEPKENYGLAQFWYSPETAKDILLEALTHVTSGAGTDDTTDIDHGLVAILSAPSLMAPAQELEGGKHLPKLRLFEIDERFGVQWPDNFHRYDYNDATVLPSELLGKIAVFVIDPPRLNMETLREYFLSTRLLARSKADGSCPPCIVVTSTALEEAVRGEFGLRPVKDFEVIHTSKLGNPLQAYTNYPPKHLNDAAWKDCQQENVVFK